MPAPVAAPAYVRIADRVARDVGAGRLMPGDRLPPEREMAADLGVAVGTLRKALARLEQAGLLVRRHGSGNYVTGAAPDAKAGQRLAALSGMPLAVAVLSDETVSPPQGISRAGTVRRVRRLHRAAGRVAAVEETWIASEAEAVTVEDTVGVAGLPAWAPPGLGPGPGGPAGHLRRVETGDAGTVCRVSEVWFDPAQAVYRARVR